MSNKARSNKSLYERSIKMVANIAKLSSFSVAKKSRGRKAGPPPAATKNVASFPGSVNSPPVSQFPGRQRVQEPKTSSKPVSYLLEPIQGEGTLYVIHEENGIDRMASDYINRFHQKNQGSSELASTLSPYMLPSPPLVLM